MTEYDKRDFILKILARQDEVDSNQIKILPILYNVVNSILKISKSILENHLHLLGYINHFDVSFLHKIKKKNGKK